MFAENFRCNAYNLVLTSLILKINNLWELGHSAENFAELANENYRYAMICILCDVIKSLRGYYTPK